MSDDPPVYRWADHPQMPPRPAEYFTAYWSAMPNPLTAKAAGEEFARLVRRNALIQAMPGTQDGGRQADDDSTR